MSEERRRSFDRRRTFDGAILEELRARYGVDTTAFLTAALSAEQKAWDFIAGRGGTFREYLPALLGRGLIASPTVCRELLRLVELGSDDGALRRASDALARRSGEMPVIETRKGD
jgi:hypothetical protein